MFQKMKLIERTINTEIRPALKKDGGDIELVDVIENKVVVKLTGACASCMSSKMTLNNFVTGKLKEYVSEDIIVEESIL